MTRRVPRSWSSGGDPPTGPSPPGCAGCGPVATGWPTPTWSTSTPSPPTSGEVLGRYRKVLVPEVNLGQLSRLLRAEYLVDAVSFTQVQGIPFRAAAMEAAILQQIDGAEPRCRVEEAADGRLRSPVERPDRPGRQREGVRLMTDVVHRRGGSRVVPVTTRKDWSSDQEVRWCPGCGDYSILAAVQMLMPELGVRRESTVFLSGIGCAARFPYYMNTYGMHSIHGRAPAIATGSGHHPARPRRVGGDRRRRRALDRGQPSDPCPPPQRQPHHPVVQQPDLRADQGPVLARPPRWPRSPSRRRSARSSNPSTRSAWPSAPRRRSWPAPTTWTAST